MALVLGRANYQTSFLSVTIKYENENRATVYVRDSLSVASVGELRRAMEKVRREGCVVTLDLADLTLADRLSLQYLAGLDKEGTELRECPSYIATWIKKISTK
jgi:anti-anti-sigma regulatory factor